MNELLNYVHISIYIYDYMYIYIYLSIYVAFAYKVAPSYSSFCTMESDEALLAPRISLKPEVRLSTSFSKYIKV